MLIDNTGTSPEKIKPERRLTEVKRELKKAGKALNQGNKKKLE